MKLYLSKSLYCDGIQCPKKLWLRKNKPEVYDKDYDNEAIFETGNAVGDLAMSLFGDVVEVAYGDKSKMVAQTRLLLEGNTPVICEASFIDDTHFCSVDILKNNGNSNVEVYEVKSSTHLKDEYFEDLSYQVHILTRLGYNVTKACLVTINKSYVRQGSLNLYELFEIHDLTDKVKENQEKVSFNIHELENFMLNDQEPQVPLGMHCFKPYDCGFFPHCSSCLSTPNVFDLRGLQNKTKIKLYNEGTIAYSDLLERGCLKGRQRVQAEFTTYNLEDDFDLEKIQSCLGQYRYPLYFLDFETLNPAIPLYDGYNPYQPIVFQFSLHYLEKEGGELQHLEFLGPHTEDPQPYVAHKLCEAIPKHACVLAYNMQFEKGCLKRMAQAYPNFHDHLMTIHDNIHDLMDIFKNGYYYSKDMKGSYSIKTVLPALFPQDASLDYSQLQGVQNGQEASNTFLKLKDMPEDEIETVRNQLLKYCELDTLAMVKIWEKLKKLEE